MRDDIRDWAEQSSWVPKCLLGRNSRSRPAPYLPGNRVPYGLSTNSSNGSELLVSLVIQSNCLFCFWPITLPAFLNVTWSFVCVISGKLKRFTEFAVEKLIWNKMRCNSLVLALW